MHLAGIQNLRSRRSIAEASCGSAVHAHNDTPTRCSYSRAYVHMRYSTSATPPPQCQPRHLRCGVRGKPRSPWPPRAVYHPNELSAKLTPGWGWSN
ncbi:hypothetical protein LX36DRAFT_115351 [Colletotrichum falcatum]|nr:hypothetical protein LX36DRAFT_115351 [Colletotrichum falcatum]